MNFASFQQNYATFPGIKASPLIRDNTVTNNKQKNEPNKSNANHGHAIGWINYRM